MPVEVKVHLRGPLPTGTFLSYQRGMHGFLFNLLSEIDPQRAAEIHESNLNPFTQALLTDNSEDAHIWRLTFLQDDLADLMLLSLQSLQSVSLFGSTLTIHSDGVAVKRQSYGELTELEPAHKLYLEFLTPISFKQQLIHQPLPEPRRLFQSWWQRWHQFVPVELGINISLLDLIEAHVAISGYRMQSVLLEDKKRRVVGSTGRMSLTTVKPQLVNEFWWRQMTALAAFGHYAGAGVKTAQGMGQLAVKY